MVSRVYLRCRACGSITLARFQIGWLDATPFAIGCSHCNAVLRGKLIQNQQNASLRLELENADEIKDMDSNISIVQEVECSGEFPVKHYSGQNAGSNKLSPFITFWQLMGNDAYTDFKTNILQYLAFNRIKGPEFRSIIDLYLAHNFQGVNDLLSIHFKKVGNPLKTITVVDGFYNLLSGVTQLLLPPKYFTVSTIPLMKYFGKAIKVPKQKERAHFIQYLFDILDLEKIESDGVLLLSRYINNFDFFLPVICLSYCPTTKIKRPYGSKYGITTTDINSITQFYADSFEWIYRASPILMGASNIQARGSCDSMPSIPQDSKHNIESLSSFKEANNGMKRHFIDESVTLKTYFTNILDNEIRNAINHFNTTFNPITQILRYYPYKGEKRSKISKAISLIDLTDETFRQFAVVHDLLFIIGALRITID